MKEQVITFETAKLAKQKGFNKDLDWCGLSPASYDESGSFWKNTYYGIDAPTQSLLQKWLRDVHNIQVYANSMTVNGEGIYRDYVAHVNGVAINDARDEQFQTYEAALEVGLYAGLLKIN